MYIKDRSKLKFSCNQKDFSSAVTNVQRAVSTKTNLPALEGILIKAEEGRITLCGYDLEIGITTFIECNVQEKGEIVVSAKLLGEIVRRLPENTVNIETDEKMIVYINSGLAEYNIVGISSEEYPELPKVEEMENISINSNILKTMIKQTIFATSDDLTKPIYTGSLFDIENNLMKIVSVDGFRMAVRQETISCDKNSKFVVPSKTLSEILKLITDEEKNVEIIIGQRHAVFKVENYSIISRLIEGNFLDYKTTIPPDNKTEIVINTRNFIAAVERMSLLTSDKIQSPIRCVVEDTQVKLFCSTAIGKANDSILAEIAGENVEIGLNCRYLLDALKNTETDEIKIQLNGSLTPMKIVPIQGDSFLFLVVPMRFKQ